MDMEISALRQNILFSTTPGHMGLTFQIGTKFQLAHVCFVIFINSKYSLTTVYKSKQPLVDLRMAFKDIEVSNGHFLGAMGWDGFFRENHWHRWIFDGFATLWPSPLTTFLLSDHWTWWFFNGFGVIQPSPFNDFQPPDHCFQWFFNGFQILDTNGQRWFWK